MLLNQYLAHKFTYFFLFSIKINYYLSFFFLKKENTILKKKCQVLSNYY